jgi:hypothetical protein
MSARGANSPARIGASSILVRSLLGRLTPVEITVVRSTVGGALLLVITVASGRAGELLRAPLWVVLSVFLAAGAWALSAIIRPPQSAFRAPPSTFRFRSDRPTCYRLTDGLIAASRMVRGACGALLPQPDCLTEMRDAL